MGPRVSDHALVRFLERAGGFDVEQIRLALEALLARAHAAASALGAGDYLIHSNGMLFVVRGETVTTVLEQREPPQRGRALAKGSAAGEPE